MFDQETRRGAVFATAAFTFWGVTPLYYKLLLSVGPLEVLAHRIFWTVIMGCLVLQVRRDWRRMMPVVRSRRTMITLLASSLLVSTNWLVYIYAIQTDRVLDASLGYYINPLVNVLLGMVFLRERMSVARAIAVALAAIGTLTLAISNQGTPWIALCLGFSFGFYGLLRKRLHVPVVGALVIETVYLLPPAMMLLVWKFAAGTAALPYQGLSIGLLLVAAGPVTMLPLLWFTMAARRLPLSVIGLFQYIGPSISFLLAVFLFGEPFSRVQAITFGCIWAGLAVSSVDGMMRAHRTERLLKEILPTD
jgi:chloramphenicol-sensitive protein RarD